MLRTRIIGYNTFAALQQQPNEIIFASDRLWINTLCGQRMVKVAIFYEIFFSSHFSGLATEHTQYNDACRQYTYTWHANLTRRTYYTYIIQYTNRNMWGARASFGSNQITNANQTEKERILQQQATNTIKWSRMVFNLLLCCMSNNIYIR